MRVESRIVARQRLIELLDRHAPWAPLPLTPHLVAWQADDEEPLWTALEEEAGRKLPPPFFCMLPPRLSRGRSTYAASAWWTRGAAPALSRRPHCAAARPPHWLSTWTRSRARQPMSSDGATA
jgi:hypothetical protein